MPDITPERRAELRGLPGRDTLTDAELAALLDATEPVTEGEAARTEWVLSGFATDEEDAGRDANAVFLRATASLVYRQARELAEARASSLPTVARPLDEWHEDMGDVLWCRFPIDEPPWAGSPNDSDWPGYHTHWTPLPPPPKEPTP